MYSAEYMNKKSLRLSIVYLKGPQVELSYLWCIPELLKIVLILATSADPDEMQHYALCYISSGSTLLAKEPV